MPNFAVFVIIGIVFFNYSWSEVKVTQLCLTLCDPMNYTVLGILQARILVWVAFPFSRISFQPRDQTRSPALQADSLPTELSGKPRLFIRFSISSSLFGEGNGTPLQSSCLENPMDREAWWAAVHGVAKNRAWLSDFTFTFNFHALEKKMATHSGILAWRIPGTGEPGGLPSTGMHRVGHD